MDLRTLAGGRLFIPPSQICFLCSSLMMIRLSPHDDESARQNVVLTKSAADFSEAD